MLWRTNFDALIRTSVTPIAPSVPQEVLRNVHMALVSWYPAWGWMEWMTTGKKRITTNGCHRNFGKCWVIFIGPHPTLLSISAIPLLRETYVKFFFLASSPFREPSCCVVDVPQPPVVSMWMWNGWLSILQISELHLVESDFATLTPTH